MDHTGPTGDEGAHRPRFDDFMHAFEAFKETTTSGSARSSGAVGGRRDDREARPHQRALDEQSASRSASANRRCRGRSAGAAPKRTSTAFDGYVRKGETGDAALRSKRKALSVGSDPDGGYLVPDETETTINASLRDISPIRAIAGIRQVSGSVYKKPFATTGAATGWVGETAVRPETQHRRWPSCRSRRWNSTPCRRRRSRCSTTAPSTSTSGSPKKCAWRSPNRKAPRSSPATASTSRTASSTYATVDNASWTWGNLGTISTGVAGAFPGSRSGRRADRSRLRGEIRLSRQRPLRHEPRNAGSGAQAEGWRRQLSLAAGARTGRSRRR